MTLSSEQRQALLDGPAASPPPGVVPNLVDPPNLQALGRALILVFWSLALIAFTIRIYTKVFIIRSVRVSDYTMIIAWALSIGYFPIAWKVADIAPGIDQWNLQVKNLIGLLHWFHTGLVMYSIIICFIKVSILRQLLEIFSLERDYFFWTCHSLICINILYYTAFTFTIIFACNPISKYWDVLRTDGKCLDTELQMFVAGIINTTSDLTILILPHLKVWRLQMSLRKKCAVSVAFLFGLIACVGSSLKIYYAVRLLHTSNNQSYQIYLLGVCTLPEIGGGIIAGCLPSSAKFVKHILEKPLLSSYKSYSSKFISSSTVARSPGDSAEVDLKAAKKGQFDVLYPLTSVVSCPGSETVDIPVEMTHSTQECTMVSSYGKGN
ncbi:hypothetical protein BO78DRAFT_379489 [Aspergillus sclerotiicarbonarius CBS 121057]|uniref:Rhodopsin domain-containing protein n=1 Tax=Aspergillus sclerotiicarbonarius (strain CBS 121057 / IBT 28362) TaxID=1448318 RepID=A0A319DTW2_ASPSB|nr:hypothetical protein BO78DRAFT_379489 [Aspergillus sclerotiicarbonarius CBS 121057]